MSCVLPNTTQPEPMQAPIPSTMQNPSDTKSESEKVQDPKSAPLAIRSFATDNSTVVNSACIPNTICLYAQVSGTDIILTIEAAASGWAGVGLGSQMSGADFYIAWKNSSGLGVISRRSPRGHSMPTYSNNQIASVVPLAQAQSSWAQISVSFMRPIQADIPITSTSSWIYGLSDNGPSKRDDPQSSFTQHSSYGNLPSVNLLSSTPVSANGTSNEPILGSSASQYKAIMTAHGILFFLAWAVAPFLGIFIARYLKNALGVWWYRLHQGLLLWITGLFTIISFILVVLYMKPPHFHGFHQVIGLVVTMATIVQITLGFISNTMWSPDRKEIPWWDKLHWWFGRILFVVAIANIYLGIREYDEVITQKYTLGVTIGYWIWIALGFCGLFYGQYHYGQFTVGKLDAGMAILLSTDHHLIEFPATILPNGITTGSIVNLTIERNIDEERRQREEFSSIQKEIFNSFSKKPLDPVIQVKSITQTSVLIKWDPLVLYSADLRGIDVYKNGLKLAMSPGLNATSIKLSGLDVAHAYQIWIVVRTSAGSLQSNTLNVTTHSMENLTGLNPTFGQFNNPADIHELIQIIERIGATFTEELTSDNTHMICTVPKGPKYERAVELNIPVVSPEFLKACETQGKMMPAHLFYIS